MSGSDEPSAFRRALRAQWSGRVPEALALYREAAAAGDRDARLNLAGLLIDEYGRTDLAVELYEQSIAGGDARALTDLGVVRYQQDEPEQAEQLFRRAIEAGDPRGHINLAQLLDADGEEDAALAEFRAAVAAKAPGSWSELALAIEDGDPDEAERLLRAGVAEDDADGDWAWPNLIEFLGRHDRLTEAEALLEQAERWRRERLWLAYGNALSEDPSRTADAEHAYRQAIARGESDGYVNLAVLLRDSGRPDDAEVEFLAALALGDAAAHHGYARLLLAAGRRAEAARQLALARETGHDEEAEELETEAGAALGADDQPEPSAWVRRAWELERDDPEEAERMLRAGVAEDDPWSYTALGALLCEHDRCDDAEAVFTEALARGHELVLLDYGNCLSERAGRAADAEAVYRRAIAAGDLDAHLNLGTFLYDERRLPEAEAEFRRALAAGQDAGHLGYATLLLADGRRDDARTQLKLARDAGYDAQADEIIAAAGPEI